MEHAAHRPVLPREVLDALGCRPGGLWVDGTVGAGGHALAILGATSPDGRLVGIDRDAEILEQARARLLPYGDRITLRHADHRRLPAILDEPGIGPVDGILLDLGVSSIQVDDPDRGFSFLRDGPLDMRMDRTQPTTAADLVNSLPEGDLARLIARSGEEPQARRVARAIVRERAKAPFTGTARLAGTIAAALPGPPGRTHAATRSFQALRIAVNDEVVYLETLVETCADHLKTGGRMAVISFHSLEDRAVKQTFRALAHRCICPRGLPVCGCGRPDLVRLVTAGALRPSPEEIRDNPRSRSARLRAVERLP